MQRTSNQGPESGPRREYKQMAEEAKKHSIYVKKLKEIGSALGFDTKARKAENGYYREQYHLANPDCVWYVAVDRRLRDLGIFPR
jgi:hypothetical protein